MIINLHREFNHHFFQDNRVLRFYTQLDEDALLPERLDGWEALDQGGYCLQLIALSMDKDLSFDLLLGSPVVLELLCADSRTDLRPFHGHVSCIDRLGSNGGLTRYRLQIEPWLALLHQRQDSFAFHDKTVLEICDQIFSHYRSQVINAAWRWDLVDSTRYLRRSLTTQYQESDFAFVERLLAEEGIGYRFEHEHTAGSQGRGRHVMVLSDDNRSFSPRDAEVVAFQRSSVTETRDSIQQWSEGTRWRTGRVARSSWNHREQSFACLTAVGEGESMVGEDDDPAGPYAWVDRTQAEQRARQHVQALDVERQSVQGRGAWRHMAPGACLSLDGHANVKYENEWVCMRVHHCARNNLEFFLQSAIESRLGLFSDEGVEDFGSFFDRRDDEEEPIYHNEFTLLPATKTYRPRATDGHGLRLHPKPTVIGAQTAIVVGDGQPLMTDRDHRVRLQFHWQRGENAASRRKHPRGQDNAPANHNSGTWSRVLTGMAGQNWGSVFVPRVGQEVWVSFIEGQIDRPVVMGALYNGVGATDGPQNRVSGGAANATGNAVAWFPGNQHDGVLSGFKTQDLKDSQRGDGGYRQLQFDDSPGQTRTHLYTTDHYTGLTLGHLKLNKDNRRLQDRGHGTELDTQAQGAVRGGSGLLLSTAKAQQQMDAEPLCNDLKTAHTWLDSLGEAARLNRADLPGESDTLPISTALQSSRDALTINKAGKRSSGQSIRGGTGSASAWGEPILAAHGGAGLNHFSDKNHIWVAGTHSLLSAGADLNLTAQGKTVFMAGTGLSIYTQGEAAPKRPSDSNGIALHAATGSVSLRAQKDNARFSAEQNISIASTQAGVRVQAKTHVLLACQGAYIKMEGGNIEIAAPGDTAFLAGMHVLGPGQSSAPKPICKQSKLNVCPASLGPAALTAQGSI